VACKVGVQAASDHVTTIAGRRLLLWYTMQIFLRLLAQRSTDCCHVNVQCFSRVLGGKQLSFARLSAAVMIELIDSIHANLLF